MLRETTEAGQAPYDRIAEGYDDRWTPHVREPQRRLTADLHLCKGERVLDLGCGTGVDTLDMLEQVAPGEVVAVDSSPAMLRTAVARARARSLSLTPLCSPAEEVVERMPASSLDVISIRFCLAYLPWKSTLSKLGALLRNEGRVGLLSNLASSTPQAFAIYRQMAGELDIPCIEAPVPETIGDISEALGQGGLEITTSWTYRLRLWFASGWEAVEWMRDSGYATHPELERFDPSVIDALARLFGARLEQRFREAKGVPLDFDLAGVVARKP